MTPLHTTQMPPTLQTLAFIAEEYAKQPDDIAAQQIADAVVAVWKAGQLYPPCPTCDAHAAQTPAELVQAAHDLLAQAIAQTNDTPPD